MKGIRSNTVLLFACIFLISCVPLASADEVTDVWSGLYKRAKTLDQKYEIMQNIYELDNRDFIPFLREALDELIQYKGGRDLKKDQVHKKLEMLVVKKLGELKAESAAPLIFTVVRDAKDPYVKSEAIFALGETGAAQYAQSIALILKNLNLYRGEDIQADEAVAYSCIKALERFKDPVGYVPILFASTAGYSRKVKNAAEEALATIVDDPTDILTEFIKTESSFEMKLEGLKYALVSSAPDDRKLAVAVEALRQGLINKPRDLDEETYLRELRTKALETFILMKAQDIQAIRLIEQILYMNVQPSEKVYAIEALGGISNTEAVKTLVRYLAYQNNRQQSGVTARDNRIVIATIRSLGRTGNRLAYEELMRVKYVGYPSVVEREADAALKKLK